MRNILTTGIWLFFFTGSMTAQGWHRNFGGQGDERGFALQQLPDGSTILAGSRATGLYNTSEWLFLRTDASGQLQSENQFGQGDLDESARVLLPWPGGGWLMAGTRQGFDTLFHYITEMEIVYVRTDVNGNPLEEFTIQEGFTSLWNARPYLDGFLLVGVQSDESPSLGGPINNYYAYIDASGQVVWSGKPALGQVLKDAAVLPNGEAILAGLDISLDYDPLFCRINALGQVTDTVLLIFPDRQYVERILPLPQGGFLALGRYSTNDKDADPYLMVLDDHLDTLWTRRVDLPNWQEPADALLLPDGRIVWAGSVGPSSNSSRDAFLACTDQQGNLLWYKTYGGLKGDYFWNVQAAAGGGFAIAGQTSSFGDGSLQAWLVRTDSLGNLWGNSVAGRVVRDTVMDCLADAGEPALSGWLVSAAGAQGSVYAMTDTLGQYAMDLDTGLWYVSVLPPAGYWTPCEDSIPVLIDHFTQNILSDFPVQAAYNCPLLYVDITAPYLTRCFENPYIVHYFNYGPAPAANATVSIIPDPFLTVSGASLPYTTAGDTLIFNVGEVPSLAGGDFALTTLLDCDSTVLGQVHCTAAHIAPDSLCQTLNPSWDGSNLDVNGFCAGDSVVLTISNTGAGNMGSTVEFVITEDQIIFKKAPIQLAAGQDTTFVLYPNGATVTLIVQQTPGHPVQNNPTLVLEACGGFPFSTGYALQFPSDDGDPFTDIDCRENVGSYDPNDKTGLPRGVGNQHLIAAGTAIEYLIRFQNTGTDTAFRVEIRDTLPPGLDLATLERGAASHPYRLNISGQGVLQVLFAPIVLPDSNVNFIGSQGFVKFRISTKKQLPAGTMLENRAAIYFDFNTPVLTEYTYHTIGDPVKGLLVNTSEPPATNALPTLSAQPNPFRDFTDLQWPDTHNGKPYRVTLTDLPGRICMERQTTETRCRINCHNLPAGFYLVRIWQAGQPIAQGKIITLNP